MITETEWKDLRGFEGSRHYKARITEDIALQIFNRAHSGQTLQEINCWLEAEYGLRVLKTTVSNIKHKRSWKHIHKEKSPVWVD